MKEKPALTQIYSPIDRDPVIPDLPDNAFKVRRNILLFSIIVFSIFIFDLEIGAKGSYSGIEINNLDNKVILTILFILILYELIYFLFLNFEHFLLLKVKLGNTIFVNNTPALKRPLSIYNSWTRKNAENISAEEVQKELAQLTTYIERKINFIAERKVSSGSQLTTFINEITNEIKKFQEVQKQIDGKLNSPSLSKPIQKYEIGLWNYQWQQLFRAYVVELFLPLLLGLTALMLSCPLNNIFTVILIILLLFISFCLPYIYKKVLSKKSV